MVGNVVRLKAPTRELKRSLVNIVVTLISYEVFQGQSRDELADLVSYFGEMPRSSSRTGTKRPIAGSGGDWPGNDTRAEALHAAADLAVLPSRLICRCFPGIFDVVVRLCVLYVLFQIRSVKNVRRLSIAEG